MRPKEQAGWDSAQPKRRRVRRGVGQLGRRPRLLFLQLRLPGLLLLLLGLLAAGRRSELKRDRPLVPPLPADLGAVLVRRRGHQLGQHLPQPDCVEHVDLPGLPQPRTRARPRTRAAPAGEDGVEAAGVG